MRTGFWGLELQPFEVFGTEHLVGAAITVLAGTAVVLAGRKTGERGQLYLRCGLIVGLLFFRVARHWWRIETGIWSVQEELPFQLCNIMAWVSIYGLGTRNPLALKAMYFLGVVGAIQAVITPDVDYGPFHYTFLESMGSHGLVVTAGVWAAAVEGYRPRPRDPWLALAVMNGLAVVVYPLNLWLGSNYLYTVHKPTADTLMDFLPGWPWYLLALQPIAVAFLQALMLPFVRSRRRSPASGGASPTSG